MTLNTGSNVLAAHAVTVAGTSPLNFTSINDGAPTTIKLEKTGLSSTTHIDSSSDDFIFLGNNHSVQGILGDVFIQTLSYDADVLIIYDGADSDVHASINVTSSSVDGLAPANINYACALAFKPVDRGRQRREHLERREHRGRRYSRRTSPGS